MAVDSNRSKKAHFYFTMQWTIMFSFNLFCQCYQPSWCSFWFTMTVSHFECSDLGVFESDGFHVFLLFSLTSRASRWWSQIALAWGRWLWCAVSGVERYTLWTLSLFTCITSLQCVSRLPEHIGVLSQQPSVSSPIVLYTGLQAVLSPISTTHE